MIYDAALHNSVKHTKIMFLQRRLQWLGSAIQNYIHETLSQSLKKFLFLNKFYILRTKLTKNKKLHLKKQIKK